MRQPLPRCLLVLVCLLGLCATASFAQTDFTGQTDSGAFFKIRVPDGWAPSDGLVIWNHGFSLDPIGPDPDLGPLVDVQLAEGYAVAASSYSLPGWAVFQTMADNRQMVRAFEDEFGVPEEVFVYGASLGGLVTAQAIEEGGLGNVVGALPICGAMAGSRLWDGGLDLRLIYDNVCGEVAGAAIPGGPTGLPNPPDPNFDTTALVLAVNACTAVALPASSRSAAQQDRLDRILELTQLPESFLLTVMSFATFGLADLIHDPRKLNGGQGVGNAFVDYGDATANAEIQRVVADADARRRFLDNYTPTGRVGDVKIVSLHTDKDGLVLVENQSQYASVVPPGNLSVGIVVEDEPSHCGFNEAEVVAAWESLRGWVAGLNKPSAQSLQTTCDAIVLGGLAEGPCRIDPGFVVPELAGRVRDRASCEPGPNTHCLNEDRFKVEVAWETRAGATGVGGTTFSTDDTGAFWFFNDQNIELTVKLLDGRPVNGRWWVFYGSLTNVSFELTVTDTESGLVTTYLNPQSNFASVGDTNAF